MKPLFTEALWKLPEFEALCKKIGIPYDLRTMSLTIEAVFGDVVKVTQTFQATREEPKES